MFYYTYVLFIYSTWHSNPIIGLPLNYFGAELYKHVAAISKMQDYRVVYYSGGSGLLFTILFFLFLSYGFWYFWIFGIFIALSFTPMIYYRVRVVEVEETEKLVRRKSEIEAFYETRLQL